MFFTEKQFQVLEFIQQYRDVRGISPTMGEIAALLRVTKVTVYEHLNQLERKGAIQREKFRSRSIVPLVRVEGRGSRLQLEIRGSIRCGVASHLKGDGFAATGNGGSNSQEPAVDLLRLFPSAAGCFVLRVEGDGLLVDQIRDGDFVIVAERTDPAAGEFVVEVAADGTSSLGRYVPPASRARSPKRRRISGPAQPRISGVVVGVLRSFAGNARN